MTSQHHVCELDAMNSTKLRPKLRPESGPSWNHVGTESKTSWEQVIFQSPTQLHKIYSSNYYIRSVTDQVGEQVTEHVSKQVPATNSREYSTHRDIAVEITNLQIHHKPCDELATQQMIDTIRYPLGSESNTALNPQLCLIVGKIEVNYDNC